MRTVEQIDGVGPVLIAGEITDKIVAAIKKLNKGVKIDYQGSYVRILSPSLCKLTKSAVQEQTGLPFVLPDDLELIMPAFKGLFNVSSEEATWTFKKKL